jgi:hypothetical protein
MQKKVKHHVGLISLQNSDQQTNYFLKKIIRAVSPIRLRRLLGTAAFLALFSVKIGGGGQCRHN